MEEDLCFYENNWELFKSANLDYITGIIDLDGEKPLEPEIVKENINYLESLASNNNPINIKISSPRSRK